MAINSNVSGTGINLATKYEKGLVQAYTRASLLTGKTNQEYNWDGTRSIHVYTAITQALGDYTRSGTWRYGQPTELQDKEQEMIVNLDKSFSMTIDRGNNDEQMNVKRTGEVVKAQIGEQVTPFFDKYALNYWATNAGKKDVSISALDKDKVLDMFIAARSWFVNKNMPVSTNSIYCYLNTTAYGYLLRNPEFLHSEKLGNNILSNGVVGKCMNILVVETPDDYLPTGTLGLFTHKKSVLNPVKSTELHTYTNVPGISGTLIEGRYRGDAFILDTLKDGVMVFRASGALSLNKTSLTIAIGSNTTMTASNVASGGTLAATCAKTGVTCAVSGTTITVTVGQNATAGITDVIVTDGTHTIIVPLLVTA